MTKNLQYKNATAWMVRYDGKVFPVIQHIYGNPSDVEETLFAAEWLYKHTNYEKTRRDVEAFIQAWAFQFFNQDDRQDIKKILHQEIESRPYVFITIEFVDKIADLWIKENNLENQVDMNTYCHKVIADLNEEFLRVRFGGMYYTKLMNRELYFRVSSENFKWKSVIINFLETSQLDYKEFYVVIDEESAEVNPNLLKQSVLLQEMFK